MRIPTWFSFGASCRRFDTDEKLFEGLRRLENEAIVCLQTGTWRTVQKVLAGHGLPAEMTEEIVNSATMVVLQKIESGAYQFQGYAVATYFVEVVKRQALRAIRSRKKETTAIDDLPESPDPDFETRQRRHEAAETVSLLLRKMGQPCADVIRLHHIDGYSDEEVISQKLTKYSTTDSLKMKRSDCMKKLVQLATQWKNSTTI